MSDNFVTCRHCGIGMNYQCDCDDFYAEERGRDEVWGQVLDTLREVYGRDMPYNQTPCELIADLVPAQDDEAPLRAAAREALDVLTEIADSAAVWPDFGLPPGLLPMVDEAKARLLASLDAAQKGGR